MEPGLDRAGGDAQDSRDLLDGQVFQEEQRENLAVRQGESQQPPVDLLRVLEVERPAGRVAGELVGWSSRDSCGGSRDRAWLKAVLRATRYSHGVRLPGSLKEPMPLRTLIQVS